MAGDNVGAHTSCAGERLLGSTHIPSPPCPAPTASAHRLVSVLQMFLRDLVRAARGSVVGNCSAPRRGSEGEARAGAHGECEGRAWKGLSGAGECWVGTAAPAAHGAPAQPAAPRQLQLPSALGTVLCLSPVRSSKITRRAGDGRVCKVLSCFSTSCQVQSSMGTCCPCLLDLATCGRRWPWAHSPVSP